MNDASPEPSGGSLWLTVLGVVACFLLFGVVLYVSYLSKRSPDAVPAPVFSAAEMKELDKLPLTEREVRLTELRWERRIPTPAERKARLMEIREKETAALSSYSWVDKENGIVRLPLDQAITLTLRDLQRSQGSR